MKTIAKQKVNDRIYYKNSHKGKLDDKYNFTPESRAMKRDKYNRCGWENCKKYFLIAPWKTGFDRDYCKKHRDILKEQEADEIINKREHDDNNIDIGI